MNYLSNCSGIEAATVAWHPLGWKPIGFAENEAFPSAVLAHHYPQVPNHGDITKYREWPDADIDVLVGGTPCQSFSVAGLRKGLADPRGNLALTFLGIADRYCPEWLIWENVPGVLSQDKGRAFASILGGMAELGYHPSYRTLDAQYVRVDGFGRAVPQRRRRVFVVGNLRDWRRAAAVLFEPESLSGNPAPRREPGKGVAPSLAARTKGGGGLGTDFDCDGGLIAADLRNGTLEQIAQTMQSGGKDGERGLSINSLPHVIAFGGNDTSGPIDVATARNAHGGPHGRLDFESETFVCGSPPVAASLTRGAESAGKGGYAGRRQEDDVNLVAECADTLTANWNRSKGAKAGNQVGLLNPIIEAVAFDNRGREGGSQFEGPHHTANIRASSGGSSRSFIAQQWAVRRLTPLECERLQGFPDGYTDIPYRGKKAADGPRYKALGNSMATNVMRWLGTRIEMVAALCP